MSVLGPIPGIPEGSTFANRKTLAVSGMHRQTMMGIAWGAGGGPAESIVVSGGYEDDEDWGDTILYTGMGGNDAGRQVRDQVLDRGNLALMRSYEWRTPVRVIRGANHDSPYSPPSGLRYDGVFRVTDAFYAPGRSAFRVWRFVLEKDAPRAAPGPWTAPQRSVVELYVNSCQVCGQAVRTRLGVSAVPWHIVPIHRPHAGHDALPNLLCLCPNHAAELNSGAITVGPDAQLVGAQGRLRVHRHHQIDPQALRYRAERYGALQVK